MSIIEKLKMSFGQLIQQLRGFNKGDSTHRDNREIENTSNPYFAARTEWNFLYNDLLKGKKNWQWVALAMIAANLLLILGLSRVALQSKYIPYVMKVDSAGNTDFSGFLSSAQQPVTQVEMNAFVWRYVESLRSIIADPIAEKKSLDYVYATTRGEALSFINTYFHNQDPFGRAKNSTIEVQINSAMPKSTKTWQVDWTEIERDLEGSIIGKKRYEALVTIAQYSLDDPKEININPLGLFATHISWSQQL